MTSQRTSSTLTGIPIYQHILFWVLYYLLFGVIWMRDGDYQASFFMEFALLPVRIGCVYFCVLYLLPQYLLQRRFRRFIGAYLLMLLVGAVLQNAILYFFSDSDSLLSLYHIILPDRVLRAAVLINTTVILVSALYILKLYFDENNIDVPVEQHWHHQSPRIEVKSNRRHHLLDHDDIVYIEGLGNYVTYNLQNGTKLTVHTSLKKCLTDLNSDSFIRVHKSFIINKNHIVSWDKESIEVRGKKHIPTGLSFDVDQLTL